MTFFLRGPSGEVAPAALVIEALVALFAVVGHACVLTSILNNLYGRPIPKPLLKAVRLLIGLLIGAFPFVIVFWDRLVPDSIGGLLLLYCFACDTVAVLFLVITAARLLRPRPAALVAEKTETLDLWKQLGPAAVGDGKYRWATRLPFNCVFQVDFTELTLVVPKLPPAWDGLSILLLSDLHFHGTPSRAFFEAVFDKLTDGPRPDLVVLAGDYVDTDEHHAWVAPLLGRLTATEGRYAILGNHDTHHDPERLHRELTVAGYTVLRNGWREATIRGERCVVVGHEGPWFRPPPDLANAPDGPFRLCVSHTPDNFYWGQRNGVGLMLCGHVHGGQIRVPVVGSIFVPSVYGRRFDMGVFEQGDTVMVVGRGLSGKEPLRFRCHPQVIRLMLRLLS
jgi:predicted MPP superfamily phosphohydrolase